MASMTLTFAGNRLVRPLYANSFWLLALQASNYLFGFLFWLLAARLYPPADVGIAAAMLPAAAMVGTFGSLGLGFGLIRFLASAGRDASRLLNQVLTLVGAVALVIGAAFLAGVDYWSPGMRVARDQPVYAAVFVVLVVAAALGGVLSQAFVALRQAGYASILGAIHNMGRVAGVAVLAPVLGGLAITVSWAVALVAGIALSVFCLLPRALPGYRAQSNLPSGLLTRISLFSFTNQAGDALWFLPGWILPLVVLSSLGPEQNAYFVVAWAAAALPFAVPQAVATAMFAEGSYEPAERVMHLKRSLRLSLSLVGLPVLALLIGGDSLLSLYGSGYASVGRPLLTVASAAVLPGTVPVLYVALARVERRLTAIAVVNGLIALATVSLSVLLLPPLGMLGIGVAVLATQSLAAAILAPGLWGSLRKPQNAQIAHSSEATYQSMLSR